MRSSLKDNRLVSESSTSSRPTTSGNVFTRSWARISGKKRRQRPPPIEESIEVQEEPLPSTSTQQLPYRLADSPKQKQKPLITRGMDKLRKSIRKSFRKTSNLTTDTATSSSNIDDSNKTPWALDEKAVRQGICKFNVKYLGSCEVYESRGVHVCEGALQHLRSKKRVTKAILNISGDGLRVIDRESNRGLIVDQTIEKVSFCAPDRHNEKGFAYICREGATRRWMCHGFMTTKESGERVSHAVGCAFTICLEQKKKREVEQAKTSSTATSTIATNPIKSNDLNDVWNSPTPPLPETNGFAKNNLAYASFRRHISIAERKQDPQKAILNEPLASNNPNKASLNELKIKPRPHANPSLFERQGSFNLSAAPQQAFKRFNSLRTDLLSRPNLDSTRLLNTEPILENDEWPTTSLSSTSTQQQQPQSMPVSTSLQFNHISESNKENGTNSSQFNGVFNSACQTTPVHSTNAFIQDRSPSRADEWLEQTFKSLSVRNDSPSQPIPSSQSIDLINFSSDSPPTDPVPSLPSTMPYVSLSNIQYDKTTNLTDSNSFNKPHNRKTSSSKRDIKYQLLEETDVPISPPRTTPASKQEVDAFGQSVFMPSPHRTGPSISDPFDVQWSAAVLNSTSSNGDSNSTNYALASHNPFSSESAPVNV